MSTPIGAHRTPEPGPYSSNEQYIMDQLERLDMLIRAHLSKLHWLRTSGSRPDFRGLILTEKEIEEILSGKGKTGEVSSGSVQDGQVGMIHEALGSLEAKISAKMTLNWQTEAAPPLERLCGLFRLTPFERDVLLVCLAPEVDRKYDKLYAFIQDDVTRKRPSVDLIMRLLCQNFEEKITARSFFHHDSTLLRNQLISFVGEDALTSVPLLSRFVKLDDRIADFILLQGGADRQLTSFLEPVTDGIPLNGLLLPEAVKGELSILAEKFDQVRSSSKPQLQCFMHGPYGSGKKVAAAALSHQLGLALLEVKLEELIHGNQIDSLTLERIGREALLRGAALLFTGMELLLEGNGKVSAHATKLFTSLKRIPGLVFLSSQRPWIARPGQQVQGATIEFAIPDYPLRRRIWQKELESAGTEAAPEDLDEAANQFKFTGGQIRDSVQKALHLRSPEVEPKLSKRTIYRACRTQCNQKLSELSQKITPQYTWKDIVLPEDPLAQLHEICDHVRFRHQVFEQWGFQRKISLGKGLTVLFSGPSGTGKTMAAEIIASELQIDLYKIDLSCVVSKYIGETEKNLRKVFEEAEQSNAILLFDEADALFGKRSEVKDSHDRYANIEVNYLLQKVEEFDGIVILASNVRGHMDDAFIRRMRFCVEFPFPDEESSYRIWLGAFPENAPRARNIDFRFMAARFKLSGGNIKNIALASAFLAAKKSEKISMETIILATKRELQKMGKICRKSDFGNYFDLVGGT